LGQSRTTFKENTSHSQFGVQDNNESVAVIKPNINESSESEDEDEHKKNKRLDDDLTQSLEDLTIDEKPTFYSSINPSEEKRISA